MLLHSAYFVFGILSLNIQTNAIGAELNGARANKSLVTSPPLPISARSVEATTLELALNTSIHMTMPSDTDKSISATSKSVTSQLPLESRVSTSAESLTTEDGIDNNPNSTSKPTNGTTTVPGLAKSTKARPSNLSENAINYSSEIASVTTSKIETQPPSTVTQTESNNTSEIATETSNGSETTGTIQNISGSIEFSMPTTQQQINSFAIRTSLTGSSKESDISSQSTKTFEDPKIVASTTQDLTSSLAPLIFTTQGHSNNTSIPTNRTGPGNPSGIASPSIKTSEGPKTTAQKPASPIESSKFTTERSNQEVLSFKTSIEKEISTEATTQFLMLKTMTQDSKTSMKPPTSAAQKLTTVTYRTVETKSNNSSEIQTDITTNVGTLKTKTPNPISSLESSISTTERSSKIFSSLKSTSSNEETISNEATIVLRTAKTTAHGPKTSMKILSSTTQKLSTVSRLTTQTRTSKISEVPTKTTTTNESPKTMTQSTASTTQTPASSTERQITTVQSLTAERVHKSTHRSTTTSANELPKNTNSKKSTEVQETTVPSEELEIGNQLKTDNTTSIADNVSSILINTSQSCRGHGGCNYSYCIARKYIDGAVETTCPTQGDHELYGSKCSSDFDLLPGKEKWLASNVWCCKADDGICPAHTVKCGHNDQCNNTYCLAERIGNYMETICPKDTTYDRECKEISDLKDNEEKRLSENRWCCKNIDGTNCRGRGRECGNDHNCAMPYCMANKTNGVVQTYCPKQSNDAECFHSLELGEERWLGNKKWCCRSNNCRGLSRKCGTTTDGSEKCKYSFCIRGRNSKITTCPSTTQGFEKCLTLPNYEFGPDGHQYLVNVSGKEYFCCSMTAAECTGIRSRPVYNRAYNLKLHPSGFVVVFAFALFLRILRMFEVN